MGLLDGKKALVTGGASGIGEAICVRFAAEGATVAVVDIDAEGADRVAKAVGGSAHVVDVRRGEEVEKGVKEVVAQMGGISVLVNNAGAGNLAPFHRTSERDWQRMLDANLTSAYHVSKAAMPYLLEGEGGAIVNNASGSGPRPTFGELAYSAAKAGLIAMTAGLAQEYGPTIRVNSVSPGVIRTPLSEPLFQAPGILDPVFAATPLGRGGTADEVASVCLFLASELSAFMTGQNLIVDGGMGLPQAGIDTVLRGLLGGGGSA